MSAYPDLEIGLHRREADSYSIELRFSHPGSDVEARFDGDATLRGMQAQLAQFQQPILDPVAYGIALWKVFFSQPNVQTTVAKAIASAQSRSLPLRVRLFIGPTALELQSLCWETLRNPDTNKSFMTDENILFSRYLSSLDWSPIDFRPQTDLRALVVVANPQGLERYKLAPVDAEGESRRARLGLGDIAVTELVSAGTATLNNLIKYLHEDYDILYLVCHGSFVNGQPWLWLEDESGAVARVAGADLATRIGELQKRPRLVVLASCQSAGAGEEGRNGDQGVLSALGPRLAEVGIPAVLAMQGEVSMKTVAEFVPVFFKELQRDGLIDRAVAAARGAVAGGLDDWWVPVLFMRLKSGRIWYVPGFQGDSQGFKKWPALLDQIYGRKCVPIIGPGVIEPLVGSSRDIARRWATEYRYPMAPYEREDLPQVAQYLAETQGKFSMRSQLAKSLHQEILQRHRGRLADNVPTDINELIEQVWALRCAGNEAEPHKVLAKLPFEIYITANADNLLVRALLEQKKLPEVEFCRPKAKWNAVGSLFEREPSYRPSVDRPLVYHLFGRIAEPGSLVLTEDDYFDFLIGAMANESIPPRVRAALVSNAQLFIGFQMHDWPFRVLYRTISQQEGQKKNEDVIHIAVQIDPEEGRIIEPEAARAYLESYFQKANLSIYWDSAENFARELQRHARKSEG
jgi:hypothetical protein